MAVTNSFLELSFVLSNIVSSSLVSVSFIIVIKRKINKINKIK